MPSCIATRTHRTASVNASEWYSVQPVAAIRGANLVPPAPHRAHYRGRRCNRALDAAERQAFQQIGLCRRPGSPIIAFDNKYWLARTGRQRAVSGVQMQQYNHPH